MINATTRHVLCVVGGLALAVAAAGCAAGGDDDRGGGGGGGTGDVGPDAGAGGGGGGGGGGGDPIAPENLIDDLDDGDGSILPRGGRVGAWYTYNDETAAGMQTPPMGEAFLPAPGGPGASLYQANTTGSGFSVWGAGMGLDLNNALGEKLPYDASGFTGIRFKAKGSVPVRASVMVSGVISAEVGGTCEPGPGDGQGCDDGHGRLLVLTPEWQSYDLPFAQLTQAGWGKPVVFDSTTVMSIQFNVDKNLVFDYAVDDLGFY